MHWNRLSKAGIAIVLTIIACAILGGTFSVAGTVIPDNLDELVISKEEATEEVPFALPENIEGSCAITTYIDDATKTQLNTLYDDGDDATKTELPECDSKTDALRRDAAWGALLLFALAGIAVVGLLLAQSNNWQVNPLAGLAALIVAVGVGVIFGPSIREWAVDGVVGEIFWRGFGFALLISAILAIAHSFEE